MTDSPELESARLAWLDAQADPIDHAAHTLAAEAEREAEAARVAGMDAMSANVFADLGYPDAEERAACAEVSHAIGLALRARRLHASDLARMAAVPLGTAAKLHDGLTGGLQLSELERILAVLKPDP